MWYVWKCPECEQPRTVQQSVADRDTPEFCVHTKADKRGARLHFVLMRRVYLPPIINANLEKDRPENNLYRILTGSSSARDQLERMKREDEGYHKDREGWEESMPKETTLDDIDVAGCWQAANAGPEQLGRWRKDNIPADDFAAQSGPLSGGNK